MKKQKYKAPCILKRVTVQLEAGFLQGSVVTKNTEIETAGQKVQERDFQNSGFNSVWE